MEIILSKQEFPSRVCKSIFLAGPTPRDSTTLTWRKEAYKMLQELHYDGAVYSPDPPGDVYRGEYNDQVSWEEEGLARADVVLFWVPRELKHMPGFTTNDEWGYWKESGKAVFGCPDTAEKVTYQKYYASKFNVPFANTLRGMLQ